MPNRVIFSDGLDVDKFIELSNRYRHLTKIIGGIGTNFTNDVGVVPLNMVIKLSRAKFNGDFIDVVKLSDTNGKHTGNPEEVKKVKELLNIK